jgi:hypothetical protein
VEFRNFFEDFPEFRHYLDHISYEGVVNPADGVFYPGVSLEIPEYFRTQVEMAIGKPKYLFLRLSPEGITNPNGAHTDDLMAKYGMIIYLNRQEHCQGGTALITHESGMNTSPKTPEEVALWERDKKNPDKWTIDAMYEMEENKAVIIPCNHFHRSEPVDGFGDVPRNARLVMVGFFDDITPS